MNLLRPDAASIVFAILWYAGLAAALVWLLRFLFRRAGWLATRGDHARPELARLDELDARLSALEMESAQLADAQRFTTELLERRRGRTGPA